MRGGSLVAVSLLITLLAGCLGGTDPAPSAGADPAPATPTSVLAGAVEPASFDAPTFALSGAIAQGGPVYGAGEPSIWAALDGTVYVAFPGCDDGPYYLVPNPDPDAETCDHGLVWKSLDGGKTFERLNRHPDGRLEEEGPAANGDADVTVDAAGTVYVSNLGGGGIQFHKSDDGGVTWTYVTNVVPPIGDDPDDREGADRQWLAAAGPGHVINTWMRTSPNRDVAINTTFDGGSTWTGTSYFGDDIGWLGTVQFAPDGQHAYIPYTQPLAAAAAIYGGQEFAMHVVVTSDGGRNWTDVDTGARWFSSMTGGHWSGTQMAPTLDVTGDGTVVVVWAQDEFLPASAPPFTATSASTILYVQASKDNGTSWSERAYVVPPGLADSALGSNIMPWVTGGAGDRFAVTFLHTDSPADSDYAGATWDVMALYVDGLGTEEQAFHYAVIDQNIHQGGVCTRGGVCTLTASDRALLDFFESDLLPDGRLIVTYPADPLTGGKAIDIRVAVQDGGSFLLERPTLTASE